MNRMILALLAVIYGFCVCNARGAACHEQSLVIGNRNLLNFVRRDIQKEINNEVKKRSIFNISCRYKFFGDQPILLSTKKNYLTYRKKSCYRSEVIDEKYLNQTPDKVIEVVYSPKNRLLSLIHRPLNNKSRRLKTESIKLPVGYFI